MVGYCYFFNDQRETKKYTDFENSFYVMDIVLHIVINSKYQDGIFMIKYCFKKLPIF